MELSISTSLLATLASILGCAMHVLSTEMREKTLLIFALLNDFYFDLFIFMVY